MLATATSAQPMRTESQPLAVIRLAPSPSRTLQFVSGIISSNLGATFGYYPAPRGVSVVCETMEGTHRLEKNGGLVARLRFSAQTLRVITPARKRLRLLGSDEVQELKAELGNRFSGVSPGDREGRSAMWSSTATVDGFGAAGTMLSVVTNSFLDEGDGRFRNTTGYATFDLRTGRRASLRALLSPAQLRSIERTVESHLPFMKEVAPAMPDPDGERLERAFGFSQRDGKLCLSVSVETNLPQVAQFVFEAPTDVEFRTRVGLG